MDEKTLIKNIEESIKELRDKFSDVVNDEDDIEKLLFFGEKYLHYILYKSLSNKIKNYKVEWESPTKQKYRYKNGIRPVKKDGKSARFDIAVKDKNEIPLVAIEFAFQPETPFPKERSLSPTQCSQHAEKDCAKLCNEKVKHPYMIVFLLKTGGKNWTQRKIKSYQKNKEDFEEKLREIHNRYGVKFLFAEVDTFEKKFYEKPFPEGWLK